MGLLRGATLSSWSAHGGKAADGEEVESPEDIARAAIAKVLENEFGQLMGQEDMEAIAAEVAPHVSAETEYKAQMDLTTSGELVSQVVFMVSGYAEVIIGGKQVTLMHAPCIIGESPLQALGSNHSSKLLSPDRYHGGLGDKMSTTDGDTDRTHFVVDARATANVRTMVDCVGYAVPADDLVRAIRQRPKAVRVFRQRAQKNFVRGLFRRICDMSFAEEALLDSLWESLFHKSYPAHTILAKQGQKPSAIHFLARGEAHCRRHESGDAIVKVLEAPSYYGEAGLADVPVRFDVTITAHTPCDVYSLTKQAFEEISRTWPHFRAPLDNLAAMASRPAEESSFAVARELARFTPSVVLQRLVTAPLTREEMARYPAAVGFVDISGFTKLSMLLREQEGQRGAESLNQIVNSYVTALMNRIQESGGDTIKFAGDAILVVWGGTQHNGWQGTTFAEGSESPRPQKEEHELLLDAAVCCLDLVTKFNNHETKFKHTLRLHAGLASGEISACYTGGRNSMWEYLVAGPPIDEMSDAANEAQAGELFVSSDALRLLDHKYKDAVVRGRPGVELRKLDGEPRSYQLKEVKARDESKPLPLPRVGSGIDLNERTEAALRSFVLPFVQRRVMAGQTSSWISEFRVMTMLFVKIDGLGYTGPEDKVLVDLQTVVWTVQRFITRFEGTVLRLIVDDKGTRFKLAFGLIPHEDDAARAVLMACYLESHMRRVTHGRITCKIGVTTGHTFLGDVGSDSRCEYTTTGAHVNMAARLMSAAAKPESKGAIYVDEETRKRATQENAFLDFQLDKEDKKVLLELKGIDHLVRAYVPKVKETAHRSMDAAEKTIVGQAELLGAIKEHVEPPAHGRVAVMIGKQGYGKTALLQEVCVDWERPGGRRKSIYIPLNSHADRALRVWQVLFDRLFDHPAAHALLHDLKNLTRRHDGLDTNLGEATATAAGGAPGDAGAGASAEAGVGTPPRQRTPSPPPHQRVLTRQGTMRKHVAERSRDAGRRQTRGGGGAAGGGGGALLGHGHGGGSLGSAGGSVSSASVVETEEVQQMREMRKARMSMARGDTRGEGGGDADSLRLDNRSSSLVGASAAAAAAAAAVREGVQLDAEAAAAADDMARPSPGGQGALRHMTSAGTLARAAEENAARLASNAQGGADGRAKGGGDQPVGIGGLITAALRHVGGGRGGPKGGGGGGRRVGFRQDPEEHLRRVSAEFTDSIQRALQSLAEQIAPGAAVAAADDGGRSEPIASRARRLSAELVAQSQEEIRAESAGPAEAAEAESPPSPPPAQAVSGGARPRRQIVFADQNSKPYGQHPAMAAAGTPAGVPPVETSAAMREDYDTPTSSPGRGTPRGGGRGGRGGDAAMRGPFIPQSTLLQSRPDLAKYMHLLAPLISHAGHPGTGGVLEKKVDPSFERFANLVSLVLSELLRLHDYELLIGVDNADQLDLLSWRLMGHLGIARLPMHIVLAARNLSSGQEASLREMSVAGRRWAKIVAQSVSKNSTNDSDYPAAAGRTFGSGAGADQDAPRAERVLRLTIKALGNEAMIQLFKLQLGIDHDLPTNIEGALIVRANGSPYVVCEMARYLVDQGKVLGPTSPGSESSTSGGGRSLSPDVKASDLAELPTVEQKVLLSKMDRLPPPEQRLLRTCAVLAASDELFTVADVQQLQALVIEEGLVSAQERDDGLVASGSDYFSVYSKLMSLEKREMLASESLPAPLPTDGGASTVVGIGSGQHTEIAFTFSKPVIREVAYATMTYNQRRHIHALAARWMLHRRTDDLERAAAEARVRAEAAGELPGPALTLAEDVWEWIDFVRLARHLSKADKPWQASKAWEDAGEIALNSDAFDEALVFVVAGIKSLCTATEREAATIKKLSAAERPSHNLLWLILGIALHHLGFTPDALGAFADFVQPGGEGGGALPAPAIMPPSPKNGGYHGDARPRPEGKGQRAKRFTIGSIGHGQLAYAQMGAAHGRQSAPAGAHGAGAGAGAGGAGPGDKRRGKGSVFRGGPVREQTSSSGGSGSMDEPFHAVSGAKRGKSSAGGPTAMRRRSASAGRQRPPKRNADTVTQLKYKVTPPLHSMPATAKPLHKLLRVHDTLTMEVVALMHVAAGSIGGTLAAAAMSETDIASRANSLAARVERARRHDLVPLCSALVLHSGLWQSTMRNLIDRYTAIARPLVDADASEMDMPVPVAPNWAPGRRSVVPILRLCRLCAVHLLGLAFLRIGDVEIARAYEDLVLEDAIRCRSMQLTHASCLSIAFMLWEQGELSEATHLFQYVLNVCVDLGDVYGTRYMRGCVAVGAAMLARAANDRSHMLQARQLATSSGVPAIEAFVILRDLDGVPTDEDIDRVLFLLDEEARTPTEYCWFNYMVIFCHGHALFEILRKGRLTKRPEARGPTKKRAARAVEELKALAEQWGVLAPRCLLFEGELAYAHGRPAPASRAFLACLRAASEHELSLLRAQSLFRLAHVVPTQRAIPLMEAASEHFRLLLLYQDGAEAERWLEAQGVKAHLPAASDDVDADLRTQLSEELDGLLRKAKSSIHPGAGHSLASSSSLIAVSDESAPVSARGPPSARGPGSARGEADTGLPSNRLGSLSVDVPPGVGVGAGLGTSNLRASDVSVTSQAGTEGGGGPRGGGQQPESWIKDHILLIAQTYTADTSNKDMVAVIEDMGKSRRFVDDNSIKDLSKRIRSLAHQFDLGPDGQQLESQPSSSMLHLKVGNVVNQRRASGHLAGVEEAASGGKGRAANLSVNELAAQGRTPSFRHKQSSHVDGAPGDEAGSDGGGGVPPLPQGSSSPGAGLGQAEQRGSLPSSRRASLQAFRSITPGGGMMSARHHHRSSGGGSNDSHGQPSARSPTSGAARGVGGPPSADSARDMIGSPPGVARAPKGGAPADAGAPAIAKPFMQIERHTSSHFDRGDAAERTSTHSASAEAGKPPTA